MKLTEKEAETKQCRISPGAMIPQTMAASVLNPRQQDQITYGFSSCFGSKCAHWRWIPVEWTVRQERDRVAWEAGEGDKTPTHGYCGLAGRPE